MQRGQRNAIAVAGTERVHRTSGQRTGVADVDAAVEGAGVDTQVAVIAQGDAARATQAHAGMMYRGAQADTIFSGHGQVIGDQRAGNRQRAAIGLQDVFAGLRDVTRRCCKMDRGVSLIGQ